jgi:hypothetical protein
MSAISNTRYAPDIAARARENYGRVLAATTRALSSPVGAVADTTLMAVLLLGLYEVPAHTLTPTKVESLSRLTLGSSYPLKAGIATLPGMPISEGLLPCSNSNDNIDPSHHTRDIFSHCYAPSV